MDSISAQFTCKCGKYISWIKENQQTPPCPNCKRTYVGKYNKKTYTIDALEVKGK